MKYLKIKFAAILNFSLLIFLLSCQNQQPPGEIVARVGDSYLTKSLLLSLIPGGLSEEDRNYFINKFIDNWINQQVVAQAALAKGVELMPNEQFQVENLHAELLANRYLNEQLKQDYLITDKEIEDYYAHNQEEFVRDHNEVHLVHLFLEQLDRAIVNEIQQSKSLQEVIEKNFLNRQINPIEEINGDLGYVLLDHLRPEFTRAIRGTRTGIIYGPIRTKDGYHFLQVLDRQNEGTVRALDFVREEIKLRLQMEKHQEALRLFRESLKKEYPVETFLTNIN